MTRFTADVRDHKRLRVPEVVTLTSVSAGSQITRRLTGHSHAVTGRLHDQYR